MASQKATLMSALGHAPYIPRIHTGPVSGLVQTATVAPDGRILAAAETDTDKQISLWDISNDREVVRCSRGESTFSADGSLWLVRRTRANPYADRVVPWLGATRTEWLLPKIRETLIYDTSTGLEIARVPRCGLAAVWDDGKTMAVFSTPDDALSLWDIPPRMAIDPALAWLASALAVLLSGFGWRLRRKSAIMPP